MTIKFNKNNEKYGAFLLLMQDPPYMRNDWLFSL